ncbi:hypothetical protein [Methyloceanibacter sp.]|uniref:hypothetical protein n=1 Tax=Methyloceanibacter sp. TaxID=1965321 RepID=UPI002D2395E5|nr:hypothetical protein [Methyloceanibacter sp.]HZP09829.1 hypothetical protein [Methyloceanibacter sp.]
MTAVGITGLEALRRRLEAVSAPEPFKAVLREEAEAIAAEALRATPGELAQSIVVEDVSRGERLGFAVGTPDPAGRAAELGTLSRPATPWLRPIVEARLPSLKDKLGKVASARLKSR